jgi:hypothetical protein
VAKSNSSAEQLDIAKNLLAVTQQMAAAVDAVNKKQMDQVQIMTQIQDAMKAMDTKGLIASVDAATKAINELTAKLSNLGKTSQQALGDMSGQARQAGTSVTAMAAAVTQAGTAAGTTTSSTAKLTNAVKDNKKNTDRTIESWADFTKMLKERFPKSAIFAGGALKGLVSTFGAIKASISFAIDAFKEVVDAIMEIGKAIISLPLDFLNMLTEKANKLASGTSEWFLAVQEVKKAYGDLQQTASSTLISMARNNESLEGTGLNARRMWGSAGAQLKEFLALAQGAGALFDSLAEEFKKTGKQLPSFAKGLGLAGEEFRPLLAQAKTMGTSVTSLAVTFTKQSLALSKQFGVSAKLISKDMAKALGDVKHFGGATVKQIAAASVYARKLGLELDKITGTLDAFETFESAADNASKLSQAFGVQVDAFKMMEAQDPAQQIDMLRKSFAAAGKDASTFNRQQLSLLATATGLDEATARQAFSMKNQGVSLDQINKKSDEAEKRQIDQIKALRELKDAMDLVAQSGSSEGGFLDKFLQGVTQGFERTTEFRGLMRNMIGTFHVLRSEGRRLGDAIMHSFPGVKMFFEGLKEIFDPKKFRKLAGGIVNELITFFKEFMSGKYSFKQLMEKITGPGGVFDKFMDAQGGAGKKVVEGFKTMWTFVTKVTTEAIRWLSEKVASGIKYIGRLISGKEKLTDGGAGSFLSETLGPIWEALKDAWSNIAPVLLDVLKQVGDTIWNWVETVLWPKIKEYGPWIIAGLFAPAVLSGVITVAATGIAAMFVMGLKKFFAKNPVTPSITAPQGAPGAPGPVPGPTPPAGSVTRAGKFLGAAKSIGMGIAEIVKTGLKLVAIAGAIAVGGIIFAHAIKDMADTLKDTSPGDLAKAGATLGAMVLAMIPMAGILLLMSKINPGSLGSAAIGLLAVAAAVGAMGLVGAGIVGLISLFDVSAFEKAGGFLVDMSKVFLMMIPILLGAVAVGAVAGSIIGGIGMVVGMGALALGVKAMAAAAVAIIKIVEDGRLSKDIGPQVDIFIKVMQSFGGLLSSLVDMLKLATPSVDELAKGDTFTKKLVSAGLFIEKMLGSPGKGDGILGIVDKLMAAVREIKVGDLGPAAEIFANLLSAVPGIMQGLKPSDAFYKAADALGGDSDEIDAMVKGANDATDNITKNMGLLIDKLKTSIEGILKLDLPDPEKAKGVGAILSGLGSIMQSMMPDPKLMEAFRFKIDGGWSGTDMEGINFAALGKFFTTYLGSLKDTLPALSSGIITSLVNAVAGIPVDQIGKLAGIGAILGALGDLINSLSAAQKNNPITMKEVSFGSFKQMLPMATTMSDIIGSLGDISPVMSGLIEGVKKLVSGMPTGTNADVFEKQVKLVVSLFSLLKSIPELAKAVKELDQVPGAKEGDLPKTVKFNLAGAISRIAEVLNFMVVGTNGGYLPPLMASVRDVYKYLTQRSGGTTLSKVAEVVTAFFENLKKLSESLSALGEFGKGKEAEKGKPPEPGIYLSVRASLSILENVLKNAVTPYLPGIKGSIMTIDGVLGNFDTTKAVGKLTGLVTSLSSLGNTFDELIGVNIPQGALITGKFSEISQALGSIASGFGKTPEGFVGPVQGVNLSQVETALANVEMTKLKSISTNFFDLSLYLSQIKAGFENVTGTFNTAGIGTALTGLTDVVDKVNALNSQLNEINAGKVQIRAGLQTLARGLGIGGSKTEVRLANRDVVINLDIQVEMDAGEVEKAMLYRSKSIIRDRLNFATQNPGLTGMQGLPIGKDQNPPEKLTATGGAQRKDL